MIWLLVCLQLQGGISIDNCDQQIDSKYPCRSYELKIISHAKHPQVLWRIFERESVYRYSRQEIKEMHKMFCTSGILL